jgi:hypothetical protein
VVESASWQIRASWYIGQQKRLKHPQVFEARQLTVEAFKS